MDGLISFSVMTAVNLDDQLLLMANEVDDIRPKRMLTTKPKTLKLFAA
jgi:hypothetical protein